MLMRADDRAVNEVDLPIHLAHSIALLEQVIEDLLPDPCLLLPMEPAVYCVPRLLFRPEIKWRSVFGHGENIPIG